MLYYFFFYFFEFCLFSKYWDVMVYIVVYFYVFDYGIVVSFQFVVEIVQVDVCYVVGCLIEKFIWQVFSKYWIVVFFFLVGYYIIFFFCNYVVKFWQFFRGVLQVCIYGDYYIVLYGSKVLVECSRFFVVVVKFNVLDIGVFLSQMFYYLL